jgi:hypothetical protein
MKCVKFAPQTNCINQTVFNQRKKTRAQAAVAAAGVFFLWKLNRQTSRRRRFLEKRDGRQFARALDAISILNLCPQIQID